MTVAVIFDLGGVLVDVDLKKTFGDFCQLTGFSHEELWQWWHTIDGPFGRGELDGEAIHQMLLAQTKMTAGYDEFTAVFNNTQQRNEIGIQYALRLGAKPDVKVGIISNTNAIHAGWLRANIPEFAQFDDVILSNEVGLLKPNATIYRLSLRQLGIAAENAMFVDDVTENIIGAEDVGMAGVQHSNWQTTSMAIENWLLEHGLQ